jgi:hypothetical protein
MKTFPALLALISLFSTSASAADRYIYFVVEQKGAMHEQVFSLNMEPVYNSIIKQQEGALVCTFKAVDGTQGHFELERTPCDDTASLSLKIVSSQKVVAASHQLFTDHKGTFIEADLNDPSKDHPADMSMTVMSATWYSTMLKRQDLTTPMSQALSATLHARPEDQKDGWVNCRFDRRMYECR